MRVMRSLMSAYEGKTDFSKGKNRVNKGEQRQSKNVSELKNNDRPLSQDEVRKKIAEHQTKAGPEQAPPAQTPKEGLQTFPVPKAQEMVNNPNDPAVRGKLKDQLSKGTLALSEKEKEVLGQILSKDS